MSMSVAMCPLPSCVPGIDLAAGLGLCLDDAEVYRHLLELLPVVQAGSAAQARQAWAAGDREALCRLAHQVRGACAQVGAREVADSAACLEALARQPGSEARLDAAVDDFCTRHDRLLAAIRQALAVRPGADSCSNKFTTSP